MTYAYLSRSQRSRHDVTGVGGKAERERHREKRFRRLAKEAVGAEKYIAALAIRIRDYWTCGKPVKAKLLAEVLSARPHDVVEALRALGAERSTSDHAFWILPAAAEVATP